MKDVVVQGEGKRGAVWMKSREMVGLLPCGKVVTGDRWRCGVSLRGLPKKNGGMGGRCREVVYLLPYGKVVAGAGGVGGEA